MDVKRKLKTAKQLERHFKGAANHWRIEILLFIYENPGISLEGIAEELNANTKTISGHTHRLVQAGLVDKKYSGRSVEHRLSPYGEIFARFTKTFQHS